MKEFLTTENARLDDSKAEIKLAKNFDDRKFCYLENIIFEPVYLKESKTKKVIFISSAPFDPATSQVV